MGKNKHAPKNLKVEKPGTKEIEGHLSEPGQEDKEDAYRRIVENTYGLVSSLVGPSDVLVFY